MLRYICKRLLLMIPTLLGAAVVVFLLMRLIPGDVCELRLAGEGAYVDDKAIQICREQAGLTRSPARQFVDWVWGLARGGSRCFHVDRATHLLRDRPAFPALLSGSRHGHPHVHPGGHSAGYRSGNEPGHVARLRCTRLQYCRPGHAFLLAGHTDHPGAPDQHPGAVGHALDAAHPVHPDMAGPDCQPVATGVAGPWQRGTGIPRWRLA